MRFIAETVLDIGRPSGFRDSGADELVAELLDDHTGYQRSWDDPNPAAAAALAAASDTRVPFVLLTHVCATVEDTMGRGVWEDPDRSHVAYLHFLAGTGYALADIETEAIANAAEADEDDDDLDDVLGSDDEGEDEDGE
jgi:hypothetical protein